MKNPRIILVGCFVLIVSLILLPDEGKTVPPSPLQILSNGAFWGKDFRYLLAYLPHWSRIGAATITVFPHEVVGSTSSKTRGEAQLKAAELAESLIQPRPSLKPEALDFLPGVYEHPIPFQPKELFIRESNAFRVGWSDPSAQFLAPSLTVRKVEEQLGPPEKVTTQLILTERDGRPVKLTLHSYAGGSIIFAASDLAPIPGVVERVILNTSGIVPVLFQEQPQ